MSTVEGVSGKVIKRKSVVLASLMGLVLGPFGLMYLGFRTFLVVFLGSAVTGVVLWLFAWFFGPSFPTWVFLLAFPLFLGFAGHSCRVWNAVVAESGGFLPKRSRWEPAVAIGVSISVLLFRVFVGVSLIYTIAGSFARHRILDGIIAIVLLVVGTTIAAKSIGVLLSLLFTGTTGLTVKRKASIE